MTQDDAQQVGISQEELAKQLYDVVMRDIEPDLLSYNLPKLAEFYADETEQQHKRRMQRYQKAYEQFTEAWRAFLTKVQIQLNSGQKVALQTKETISRAGEKDDLAEAAEAIDSLS